MKIAFFVHGYLAWDVYGVPRHVERLAGFLAKRGHEVVIIVVGRPNLPKIENAPNLMIYRTRYVEFPLKRLEPLWSFLLYTLGCLFEAPRLIKNKKVDLIHGHTVQWGGPQAAFNALLTKRPCIVTVHGSGLERYPLKRMPRRLYFLKLIDALVVQKLSAYDKLMEWRYPRDIIYLTEGCVNIDKFKPASEKTPRNNSVVTFAGRLTAFKGPQLLLKAAPYVLDKRNNIVFQFVGEGDLKKELMEEAKAKGLESKVNFLGFRQDVNEIFRSSDVSVHLSPFENFTDFALLEAMSSGVPVVATNVGETKSIVSDGFTGLLAKPHPRDIAEKILKILEEPALAESLSKNERELIVKEYSLEVFGARHEELYRKVICRKQSKQH